MSAKRALFSVPLFHYNFTNNYWEVDFFISCKWQIVATRKCYLTDNHYACGKTLILLSHLSCSTILCYSQPHYSTDTCMPLRLSYLINTPSPTYNYHIHPSLWLSVCLLADKFILHLRKAFLAEQTFITTPFKLLVI